MCEAVSNTPQFKDHFAIIESYQELLVNQLMADVLYDKYLDETAMTLNEYCTKHFYVDYDNEEWKKLDEYNPFDENSFEYSKDRAYKLMEGRMKSYAKAMAIPARRAYKARY